MIRIYLKIGILTNAGENWKSYPKIRKKSANETNRADLFSSCCVKINMQMQNIPRPEQTKHPGLYFLDWKMITKTNEINFSNENKEKAYLILKKSLIINSPISGNNCLEYPALRELRWWAYLYQFWHFLADRFVATDIPPDYHLNWPFRWCFN